MWGDCQENTGGGSEKVWRIQWFLVGLNMRIRGQSIEFGSKLSSPSEQFPHSVQSWISLPQLWQSEGSKRREGKSVEVVFRRLSNDSGTPGAEGKKMKPLPAHSLCRASAPTAADCQHAKPP